MFHEGEGTEVLALLGGGVSWEVVLVRRANFRMVSKMTQHTWQPGHRHGVNYAHARFGARASVSFSCIRAHLRTTLEGARMFTLAPFKRTDFHHACTVKTVP